MSLESDRPASDYYYDLIASFLDDQEKIKASLEKRANEVLAGIATIITILVAVAALAVGDSKIGLDGYDLVALSVALAFFLLAGIGCLFVLVPRKYKSIRYGDFDGIVAEDGSGYVKYWKDPDPAIEDAIRTKVAGANLSVAKRAQEVNGSKAVILVGSVWLAFFGVVGLGTTLVFAIT